MKTIVVQPNQSFLDVVLMGCGTLEAAMSVAFANDLSVTDNVVPGQVISVPADAVKVNGVLDYLQSNGYVIGTKAATWMPDGFIDEPGANEFLAENDDLLIRES